jgi:catechol-2,3-dioxygenase
MSLAAAVIFVSDLDRSHRFYCELLALEVELETDGAMLLTASDGSHVVLRRLERAVRGSGFLGVQSLIWSVDSEVELRRCGQVLASWNSQVRAEDGRSMTTIEGRDPDRLPILVTYRCSLKPVTSQFPSDVFAYY